MIRKVTESEEIEEKRRTDDHRKLSSKHISPEMDKQLSEIGGFSRKQLYNRRGGPTDKGLALLLEPGDELIEVVPGRARIKTREGTVQTFYNLEQPHDFLTPVPEK